MDSYKDVDPEVKGLGVKFERLPVETVIEGKRTWTDHDFVHVVADQESELVIDLTADTDTAAKWKDRLGSLFANWQRTQVNKPLGYPLEKFFANEPSKAKAYESREIWTVEQLAASADSNLQGIGLDAFTDRRKAQSFLEDMKQAQSLEPLVGKIAELENERDSMRKLQAELMAKLEALEKAQTTNVEATVTVADEAQPIKRGPGRPRKTQEMVA